MGIIKRMLPALLVTVMVLAGCTPAAPPEDKKEALRESGDVYSLYSGEIKTINYLVTSTTAEFSVAANTVDCLVEYDHLGIVKPALATEWSVSDDGLVWAFKIREGVKWYNYKGEEYAEVVAQDWVDALKYSFDPDNASSTANISYSVIKNGEAYFKGEIDNFEQVGVKAKDKYTLEYTLNHPVPYFLSMLTYCPFMPANGQFLEEVGESFGTDNTNILYNGAYILSAWEPQNQHEFIKNEDYWDADNVYIKKIVSKYNKEASTLAPEMFLRGEITGATVPTDSLDDWMNDPEKSKMVRPASTSFYSYFYAFNFNPKFPDEYEPENWTIAVNNKNFRKSIFHGLDRVTAIMTMDPYEPERMLTNTITLKNFAAAGGKDYTQIGDLAAITAGDSFSKELALECRDLAKQELDGKANFPVKIMMPYRTSDTSWTNEAQVVEQQLEGLLGEDFIDIIPVGFPPSGFLDATRRQGNYALQLCNWGPDYADPETYSEPFWPDGTYNWPEKAEGYMADNGKTMYENMLDAARAEVVDVEKRFELFARAEALVINEAWVIPFRVGGGGYVATKLEPFTSPYAPFGVADLQYKGQIVMEKPMSSEEYKAAYDKWIKDRAAALEAELAR
ncbi:MAG: peptide ABC transporter substrate-binding protein [Bacillota bacterium]|jgi:oligopeptide transport system substrate-binding protein